MTTTTYRTAGTTDDVTICGICGREELKGTVRLELVDGDGVVRGEEFAGSTCAATIAGRSAAVILREARDADRDAEEKAREREHAARFEAERQVLVEFGLERNFANVKRVRAILKERAEA